MLTYDEYAKLVDYNALAAFRANALNPEDPRMRSLVDNPDIYFQLRESNNTAYAELPDIVEDYMAQISKLTGREYHLFNYYGAPDAERVIVAMGSVGGCAQEVVNYLNAKGEKVGFLQVHLFRPFSMERLLEKIPATCKCLTVLDRTKEPGAPGEPLYLDVCDALWEGKRTNIEALCGRYGLGSKDTTPAQMKAVFDNMKGEKKNHFTVGINDDVNKTSLPYDDSIDTEPKDVVRAVFFGLGADGTVGANKNSIKIIAEDAGKYGQGYFVYDSRKSGSMTTSHLRFSDNPIKAAYLISKADFVACHQFPFMSKVDILKIAKPGATFLLNAPYGADEVWDHLPIEVQEEIINKKLKFYTINAVEVARQTGMGTVSYTHLTLPTTSRV